MLIVVEDGDIQQLLEFGLDPEALRRLDVFQIDAAERDADVLDDGDDLVGIAGGDLDIDAVDIGEPFEQNRFSFHHRLGGGRPPIPETQDGRAVGDHGDQISLGGVFVGEVGILGDRQHRGGDTRGIGKGKVALRGHGLGRHHGDLPGRGIAVEGQRLLVGEGLLFRLAHGLPLDFIAPPRGLSVGSRSLSTARSVGDKDNCKNL